MFEIEGRHISTIHLLKEDAYLTIHYTDPSDKMNPQEYSMSCDNFGKFRLLLNATGLPPQRNIILLKSLIIIKRR